MRPGISYSDKSASFTEKLADEDAKSPTSTKIPPMRKFLSRIGFGNDNVNAEKSQLFKNNHGARKRLKDRLRELGIPEWFWPSLLLRIAYHDASRGVDDLLRIVFGYVAIRNPEKLKENFEFYARRQEKIELAISASCAEFEMSREDYNDLEAFCQNFVEVNPAPRSKFEFAKEAKANGYEPIDIQMFGQIDILLMFGPQLALLMRKYGLNSRTDQYPGADCLEEFPTTGGRQIGKSFFGPVVKYEQLGIVSKSINLRKLDRMLNSGRRTKVARFNDYPPNEILIHRCLYNYFHLLSDVSEPHPCIVPMHGITHDEERKVLFYYMQAGTDYFAEIKDGRLKAQTEWLKDLKDLRSKGKLQDEKTYAKSVKSPWEIQMRKDFICIARAVEYMHELRICHRDLKLENVVRHPDGRCMIIDYGVAIWFGEWEDFTVNDRVGTGAYMSPECWYSKKDPDDTIIIENQGTWNAKTNDMWTLGVILFMMMCAAPPYNEVANNDPRFVYATERTFMTEDQKERKHKNASLRGLIKSYNVHKMVTEKCTDFIRRFFRPDSQRITWEEIWQHPWIVDDEKPESEKPVLEDYVDDGLEMDIKDSNDLNMVDDGSFPLSNDMELERLEMRRQKSIEHAKREAELLAREAELNRKEEELTARGSMDQPRKPSTEDPPGMLEVFIRMKSFQRLTAILELVDIVTDFLFWSTLDGHKHRLLVLIFAFCGFVCQVVKWVVIRQSYLQGLDAWDMQIRLNKVGYAILLFEDIPQTVLVLVIAHWSPLAQFSLGLSIISMVWKSVQECMLRFECLMKDNLGGRGMTWEEYFGPFVTARTSTVSQEDLEELRKMAGPQLV